MCACFLSFVVPVLPLWSPLSKRNISMAMETLFLLLYYHDFLSMLGIFYSIEVQLFVFSVKHLLSKYQVSTDIEIRTWHFFNSFRHEWGNVYFKKLPCFHNSNAVGPSLYQQSSKGQSNFKVGARASPQLLTCSKLLVLLSVSREGEATIDTRMVKKMLEK